MSNIRDLPNLIRSNTGRSTFTAGFGDVYSVAPMHHVNGLGHQEHVRVSFYGGCSLELDLATAIGLARRIPEAVAALPIELPDCSGAVVDLEGVGMTEFIGELPEKQYMKPRGIGVPDKRLIQFAADLRANPGKWAKWPKPLSKNTVGSICWSINHGGQTAPAYLRTGFEAAVRQGVLYVRAVES